ncbi:MAG: hypothetical protein ACU841_15230 [Gammaproteobacteria bacterium]
MKKQAASTVSTVKPVIRIFFTGLKGEVCRRLSGRALDVADGSISPLKLQTNHCRQGVRDAPRQCFAWKFADGRPDAECDSEPESKPDRWQ